jgi:hypothetical protein
MINVDLTKAFHPKVADWLTPFLPGLFFEICVLLANPQYARQTLMALGAERYVQLFVVFFLAFVIGSVLLQWVRLIQIQFSRLQARLFRREPKRREKRIKRLQAQIQAEQTGQPQQAQSKAVLKLQAIFNERVAYEDALKNAQNAWGVAATELLKR